MPQAEYIGTVRVEAGPASQTLVNEPFIGEAHSLGASLPSLPKDVENLEDLRGQLFKCSLDRLPELVVR